MGTRQGIAVAAMTAIRLRHPFPGGGTYEGVTHDHHPGNPVVARSWEQCGGGDGADHRIAAARVIPLRLLARIVTRSRRPRRAT